MRKRLKNLKNKSGHSDSSPRQMIDEMVYREHGAHVLSGGGPKGYDSAYSGWSHASRPRDYAISIRKHFVTAPTAPSGPT